MTSPLLNSDNKADLSLFKDDCDNIATNNEIHSEEDCNSNATTILAKSIKADLSLFEDDYDKDATNNEIHSEENCNLNATTILAKSIKAIDKTTVHKICSGQVVLTLATAVKELVENSIDAGATSVEIRLVENGSSLIEVSDNGKGVEPCDFEGLTLKHHTSKLQDFGDLIGVQTFGFRGEALSSLCALSNLTIITRHNNQNVGTKLIYNTNGHLMEKIPTSRQVGTTVTLENLFYTLPVRHKEFLRNLKKEFNKMVQVLYSYCLMTTDVRIVCTNLSGKNKTTVVSTESHSSLKENISSIFGHKQTVTLLSIEQKSPNEDILSEYGVRENDSNEFFRLEGFISTCAHGKGRSANDRQFYFINKRPCDPAKIIRVVNEVYHHYNKHQFPMVVLNVRMEKEDVDINVTPDKRQIFFSREKFLLATIKATLINLYEDIPSTLNVQSFSIPNFSSPKISSFSPASSFATPGSTKLSSLTQRFARTPSTPTSSNRPSFGGTQSNSSYGSIKRSLSAQSEFQANRKQPRLQDFAFDLKVNSAKSSFEESSDVLERENHDIEMDFELINDLEASVNNLPEDSSDIGVDNEEISFDSRPNCEKENEKPKISSDNVNSTSKSKEFHCKTESFLSSLKARQKKCILTANSNIESSNENEVILVDEMDVNSYCNGEENVSSHFNEQLSPKVIYDDMNINVNKTQSRESKVKCVDFNLESLKQRILRRKKLQNDAAKSFYRKFRAQIAPTDNKSAEEELNREISKESFSKMNIIGQFNLGFMITRLHSDLFIIDQHATDEKYNFETLQKTCILQNQKLIIPQTLELTAANEGILIDNLNIFTKNGFEFNIDDSKDIGRRVMLVSMPHSKGWEFKKEDVEEMIFLLSDSPGIMCRPSRISAMFASRACRKSVMIGTHLSGSQMRKLVDHMGEIEQPWNCPHGRPTIRHLINLDVLTKLR